MSRISESLLDRFTDDLRLRSLGLEMAAIWLLLVNVIRRYGRDGLFVPGLDGQMTLSDLARFHMHIDAAHLETCIETYAKARLLTHDAKTGAIGLPGIEADCRRASASRENGKKGGRPPKVRAVTPRNDPRQKTAIMSISGGKDVSQDNLGSSRVSQASLAYNNSSKEEAKLDTSEIDAAFKRIGPKAFEAAGFDPARSMVNFGIARQWCADAMRSGLSAEEAERLILGVVASVAERQQAKGQTIAHMGYFKRAIGHAIERRDVPAPVMSRDEMVADRLWTEAMQDYSARVAAGETGMTRPVLADFMARARAA